MSNYKFKVGETYPLRGGGTAEILKVGINTVSGDTIVGLVKDKDGYEDVRSWHPDGNYLLTATHHFDLLPPEPEREMSDIDDRLEEEILHAFRKSFDSQQAGINANFLMDIQIEIERLRDELAAVTEERDRMREALRPFADAVDIFITENHDAHRTIVTLGDFFHARAALEGVTEPQQSGEGNHERV